MVHSCNFKASIHRAQAGMGEDTRPLHSLTTHAENFALTPNGTGLSAIAPTSDGDRSGGSTPSQGKNFEFVLVTDSGSRRQVRRHAMRQYMRKRRLDSIARLDSSRLYVGGWSTRQDAGSSSPFLALEVEDAQDEEHVAVQKSTFINPKQHLTGPHKLVSNRNVWDSTAPACLEPHSKPPSLGYTPGDGVLFDPFDSFPIAIDSNDHQLIQHFVSIYPSMMYKLLDPMPKNPMMKIFQHIAMCDPVPFQAMLAIASKHRAGVEGKTESVQSLTHKMRALRLINECIQTRPDGYLDGIIYAVATMAVIEKWSKDFSVEQMHFSGLASMIRSRGGMRGLHAANKFLENIIYWVDYSCASNAIVGSSLPWTGDASDSLPQSLDFLVSDSQFHLDLSHNPSPANDPEDMYDHVCGCEDFLRFFRRLHDLEHSALNSPGGITGDFPEPQSRFGSQTKLFSILTTLPDYDHGIRDVRFIDEYSSMACLLYLNVALYDCYLNSTPFDRYLDWVHLEIQRLSPHSNPSIAAVLWLFLTNGGYPRGESGDAGERSWVVSRMLRVAKRLEWKRQGALWECLRRVLIGFLTTQQECSLGSAHINEHALAARQRKQSRSDGYFWDEDEMRRNILGLETPIITSCSAADSLNSG
ncbi:hypothetical protein ASPZODRAFT_134940 [Penicilliopsis zonata CBS 506.65]|uniref:Transcription factor domain-containing protein n=1 Tax=Penicilliopsis zonata CBS 506.65 TaxID=1073090 RepID=A0A1L9SC98_9EURO|nr:hypothetical protein ASPZODRAFT_134940 [Penicilliopsis zonata CBS 506.65]OJJ44801.1 hypothetical protein ASPZODRAFT_134940 [Penicilliopsis zonata CBS 506.65]